MLVTHEGPEDQTAAVSSKEAQSSVLEHGKDGPVRLPHGPIAPVRFGEKRPMGLYPRDDVHCRPAQ